MPHKHVQMLQYVAVKGIATNDEIKRKFSVDDEELDEFSGFACSNGFLKIDTRTLYGHTPQFEITTDGLNWALAH